MVAKANTKEVGALVAGGSGTISKAWGAGERDDEAARDEPDGKRQVPVLFVQADGLVAAMQQERSPNREIKMVMSHEGWSPRHPASDEYELLQRNYPVTLDGKDFWEEAGRKLYSIYGIDEKTWAVINGDRAGWIREGVKYFPRAIHQIDRKSCWQPWQWPRRNARTRSGRPPSVL